MQESFTYQATIYVGQTEGYDGPQHSFEEAVGVAQKYVDRVGLCVTVTPTTFVYKGGREYGVAVGFINYPRFPSSPGVVRTHALNLARLMQAEFKQNRVSVVLPGETVMLELEEAGR